MIYSFQFFSMLLFSNQEFFPLFLTISFFNFDLKKNQREILKIKSNPKLKFASVLMLRAIKDPIIIPEKKDQRQLFELLFLRKLNFQL